MKKLKDDWWSEKEFSQQTKIWLFNGVQDEYFLLTCDEHVEREQWSREETELTDEKIKWIACVMSTEWEVNDLKVWQVNVGPCNATSIRTPFPKVIYNIAKNCIYYEIPVWILWEKIVSVFQED